MTIHAMIDIDDVLFPWADLIHDRSRVAGLHDIETYTTWHMWEDYGCSKEAWLEVVDKATVDGMYHEPPMPGAVEALRRLVFERDVAIHLVTARGFMAHAESIREWTADWVEEYAVPHVDLTFAKDKVASQVALGVRFDYALDDGLHNFTALDADGVDTYLMTRPHNVSAPVWAASRVSSVDEFVDIILKESA